MLVYFPYRNAIETAHFTKSDEEPTSFTPLLLRRFWHIGPRQSSLSKQEAGIEAIWLFQIDD